MKQFLLCTFLLCAALQWAPVWANAPSECVYESSGVDVDAFKQSELVTGFEQLEKNSRYSGNLKGIGGFQLQLFGCVHYGAKLTVLLGPSDDVSSLEKALGVLPKLLFPAEDAKRVVHALREIPAQTLTTHQHLQHLAEELNLTDIHIRLFDVDGVSVLVFGFYGG